MPSKGCGGDDAAVTIQAFAARLRQGPDLDRVADELMATADQAI
jgi:hypothetical protein